MCWKNLTRLAKIKNLEHIWCKRTAGKAISSAYIKQVTQTHTRKSPRHLTFTSSKIFQFILLKLMSLGIAWHPHTFTMFLSRFQAILFALTHAYTEHIPSACVSVFFSFEVMFASFYFIARSASHVVPENHELYVHINLSKALMPNKEKCKINLEMKMSIS